jgi:hypothetical protein
MKARIGLSSSDYILRAYNLIHIPNWIMELKEPIDVSIEIIHNGLSSTEYSIPLNELKAKGRRLSLKGSPFVLPKTCLKKLKVNTCSTNKTLDEYL